MPSPVQLTAGRQQVQRIGEQKKVLGAVDERRLVVLGFGQIQFAEIHDVDESFPALYVMG